MRRVGFEGRSHSEEERKCSPLKSRRVQNDRRNSDLVNTCIFPERCGLGGTIKIGRYGWARGATTGRKVSIYQIVKI